MNQPFIKNARFTFHSLAWIFAVGILIQVFLATWKTRLFPRTAEDIHE